MSDLYWLTEEQIARLEPYFPKAGRISDYIGAAALLADATMRTGSGKPLREKGTKPCIPGRNLAMRRSDTTNAAPAATVIFRL